MASSIYNGDKAVCVVYGPSGAGKCLAGTCEVVLGDGTVRTVREIVDDGIPRALPALHDDYKVRPAVVASFHRNGPKPVVRVVTKSGRSIDVTLNHPLLGALGWKPVSEFGIGDFIAVPRTVPVFGDKCRPEHEVDFLALYLADGTFVNSAVAWTSGRSEKVAAMKQAVAGFGGVEMIESVVNGEATITWRIRDASRSRQTHAVHRFLRDCGLEEKRSASKFVPEWVFRLPREQLARFLSLYLGSDGGVESGRCYSFTSASERMLRQMAHLLLRFGIRGRIRTRIVKDTTYWTWTTSDAESVEAMRTEIAPLGKPIPERDVNRADTHDVLPIPNREIGRGRCWPDSPISRHAAQRLPAAAPHVELLAHSDIYWDRIRSVEPLGTVETFDLTVPGPANFIANDVFAHNTVDMLYSFPCGLFIAPPGALKPAQNVVGHVPSCLPAPRTIPEATKILVEVGNEMPDRFDAVVVDDFSLLADATISDLEQRKVSGFKLWGALRDAVIEFRNTARRIGLHVVMTAHESTPRSVNGVFVRGGPRLPGRLPEDLPTACDIVLRTSYDNSRRGWHQSYRCTVDDPSWCTKDRHGVTPDRAPMNLGEILRAAGYSIRRAPGLEWQEKIVEAVAQAIVADPDCTQALLPEIVEACRAHTADDLHVRWVVRDALDRAELRRHRARALEMYLSEPSRSL